MSVNLFNSKTLLPWCLKRNHLILMSDGSKGLIVISYYPAPRKRLKFAFNQNLAIFVGFLRWRNTPQIEPASTYVFPSCQARSKSNETLFFLSICSNFGLNIYLQILHNSLLPHIQFTAISKCAIILATKTFLAANFISMLISSNQWLPLVAWNTTAHFIQWNATPMFNE